jgi:precorrin-6B C5,15-methyltransferase / cobalt-precorrin-6B C5,C15-methyltransferase
MGGHTMITVIGLDGSPLSRHAAEAMAGATLLVGGHRHLAAAGVAAAGVAVAGVAVAGVPAGVPAAGVPAAGVPAAGVPAAGVPAAGVPAAGATTIPRVIVLGPLRPALDALAAHDGDAVVLASGDPGFFGIVRALRERGLGCEVLPATSSVALAFARAGLPWDDAVVVSAHGRELRAAVNVCRAYPKVAVLTGPGQGPAEIGAALAGWPRRLLVAEDLGGVGERITECTPADSAARTWTDPNVVLALASPDPSPPPAPPLPGPRPFQAPTPVTQATPAPPAPSRSGGEQGRPPASPRNLISHENPTGSGDAGVIMGSVGLEAQQPHDHDGSGPARDSGSHMRPGGPSWRWPRWAGGAGGPAVNGPGDQPGWALAEEAFEHRDSMVTKSEVRALALARLGPRPGTLVWDVGAGSGSVAVECARFGAAVIAVERDPAQCARVTANARRHGANVRVVAGAAPEALDGLPDADAVFVGGGGLAVLAKVAARRPARIVLALAAVQRVGQAAEVLGDAGYTVDGTMLQASRLVPLPDGAHRLAAANPVFLLWAQPSPHHDHGQFGAP